MIAPIFSGLILRRMTRGANRESSPLGLSIACAISPRMKSRPSRAWVKRFAHDLRRDAFDLDVHLNGGDTLGGARDLEVHIAEGVFHALDIAQDRVSIGLSFGDESHGDAGDGRRDRNSGVHQRQCAAADARHGGRAVELTTSETRRMV